MLTRGPDVARGGYVAADVCVVGAGPVGIAVARKLAGSGLRTVVLESGGLDYTRSLKHPLRVLRQHSVGAQALAGGRNIGQRYTPLRFARARAFGGSTRALLDHGLMARPFDPIDFEPRAVNEPAGWPVRFGELDPYLREGQEVCGLGPYRYDADWLEEVIGRTRLPFDGDAIETTAFQFAPGDHFAGYLDEFRAERDIELITEATVTNLIADADGAVASATVRSWSGTNQFDVRANVFVLAAGGIDNARLLLHASRTSGLAFGNDHDMVGRCFMEHPQAMAASWWPSKGAINDLGLYEYRQLNGFAVAGQLRPTDELQRSRGLLNTAIDLYGREPGELTDALKAARALRQGFAHKFPLPGFSRHVRRSVVGLPHLTKVVARRLAGRSRESESRVESVTLTFMAEQRPNPESRVTLGTRTDGVGMPRAILDWRLTDQDFDSMRGTVSVLANEIGRLGLGDVQSELDEPNGRIAVYGNWHHMGTTRMHADPRAGVVDPDSRVHGMANLYVAGTSVFPTSGCSNPTLTGVAMALRLAEHLKRVA